MPFGRRKNKGCNILAVVGLSRMQEVFRIAMLVKLAGNYWKLTLLARPRFNSKRRSQGMRLKGTAKGRLSSARGKFWLTRRENLSAPLNPAPSSGRLGITHDTSLTQR